MSPTVNVKGAESGTARILGSGASGVSCCVVVAGIANDGVQGIAELIVFHPVDTIAKRLMSNKSKVRPYTKNT